MVFKLRDRLRSQFTRGIGTLVKGMETQGQWEALIALLSKVIEFDPLNENFIAASSDATKLKGVTRKVWRLISVAVSCSSRCWARSLRRPRVRW